jgi:hypothetical protein
MSAFKCIAATHSAPPGSGKGADFSIRYAAFILSAGTRKCWGPIGAHPLRATVATNALDRQADIAKCKSG